MSIDYAKPAIAGGVPVRTQPLPQEWCGTHHIDEQEVEAVTRVVRSRSLFRYYGHDLQGEVDQLERNFADYIGVPHALAVSSGTAALQVALGALGVGPGDEVILPGYFWVASVAAVVRSGAIPVLADVDESFSLDPDQLESLITPRTKAVMVVHMGGVIGRINAIVDIARRHKLSVIEDCAQVAGASQFGVKAGAFGDISIFSFQLNKNMTCGEGGMVCTRGRALFDRAFAIHDLGYPRGADGRLDYGNPDTQLWGIGCRMNELSGAVARVQLSKLDGICTAMREAKYQIRQAIESIDSITLRTVADPAGDSGGFLMMTLPCRAEAIRFVEAIRAEGIVADEGGQYPIHMEDWGLHNYFNLPSLVHKRGLSQASVWNARENAGSNVSYAKGTCPRFDELVTRTVILCVASNLTPDDVRDISTAIMKTATWMFPTLQNASAAVSNSK